jgi:hypothetical protein
MDDLKEKIGHCELNEDTYRTLEKSKLPRKATLFSVVRPAENFVVFQDPLLVNQFRAINYGECSYHLTSSYYRLQRVTHYDTGIVCSCITFIQRSVKTWEQALYGATDRLAVLTREIK